MWHQRVEHVFIGVKLLFINSSSETLEFQPFVSTVLYFRE